MLIFIKNLLTGKLGVYLIIAGSLCILALAANGMISWSSPEVKLAEEFIDKEAGIDIEPASK